MELKAVLESLLFASQKPLSPREMKEVLAKTAEENPDSAEAKAFKKISEGTLLAALAELENDFQQAGRSFRLACVAGSWQFVSQPECLAWIKALVGERNRPARLSQPALETLAIIAYRQPLTRAEIEQIRGVSVDGVLQTLLERGLVEARGRAEVVGRPMTYGTTQLFVEHFGLRSLEDLPAADELRRIPVARPESLLTVEPGLATAPPEPLQSSPAPPEPSAEPPAAPTPAEPPTA